MQFHPTQHWHKKLYLIAIMLIAYQEELGIVELDFVRDP